MELVNRFEDIDSLTGISMNVTANTLVVSIQTELHDDIISELQRQILTLICNKKLRGALIDVSGVKIIDSFILRVLIDIVKMAKLLNAKVLYTGLKPEIIATLVDFGDISSVIRVVLNIDEGLQILSSEAYGGA